MGLQVMVEEEVAVAAVAYGAAVGGRSDEHLLSASCLLPSIEVGYVVSVVNSTSINK